MWPIYTVMAYFLLALLIPAGWALIPVWRRARRARRVSCPANDAPALVGLDPWYAMKGRALGGYELRVRTCSRWPGQAGCERDCLERMQSTV
jgi:hypothetical protein